MNINDEVRTKLRDAADNHANRIRGKSVREVMTTEYEPPDDLDVLDDGLDLSDPNIAKAVDFWDTVMREWRQKYGGIDGYTMFNSYWYGTNVSAAEFFLGDEYESLRDKFGYADDETLYHNSAEDIARGYSTVNGTRFYI